MESCEPEDFSYFCGNWWLVWIYLVDINSDWSAISSAKIITSDYVESGFGDPPLILVAGNVAGACVEINDVNTCPSNTCQSSSNPKQKHSLIVFGNTPASSKQQISVILD